MIAAVTLMAGAAASTSAYAQQTPGQKLVEDADHDAIDQVNVDLASGADVNSKDDRRWTALMFAAVRGDAELVRLLLQRGADVNLKTNEGNTALNFGSSDPEISNLLRSRGALALNQECVDPSVAAQPENLDKPICVNPPPAPSGSPNWFRHGLFPVTEGRVGYHMTSHNAFYDRDVPPECNHDAQYSYMLDASVDGELPPGLTYSSERAQFEGTPRQPGDWDVTVVYSHMRCRGSNLDFGDRRIPVHFHINP